MTRWKNAESGLRVEIDRLRATEAHAAEREEIADPSIRELVNRINRLNDDIAVLVLRDNGKLDDLDLDTLRKRLKDATDRRDEVQRLSRDPADPLISLLEPQIKLLKTRS